MAMLDDQTLNILKDVNSFTLQQKVNLLEGLTGGCIEAPNKYEIFDGTHGTRLLEVEEESGACVRCCCAPNHTVKFNVHAVSTEGTRLYQVMTVGREGCGSKPCLGCCVCSSLCAQEASFYVGGHEGVKMKELPEEAMFGKAIQPSPGGGGLTPIIKVMERDAKEPFIDLKGPTCIGGCSELCCATPFKDKDDRVSITKKKPSGFGGALRELLTDADTFTMEVQSPDVTPMQKASLLGSVLLMDLMFFERDVVRTRAGALGPCPMSSRRAPATRPCFPFLLPPRVVSLVLPRSPLPCLPFRALRPVRRMPARAATALW